MITIPVILSVIIIAWVFVYTISYANWTWKQDNKSGAIAIYVLALLAFIVPLYTLIFRQ